MRFAKYKGLGLFILLLLQLTGCKKGQAEKAVRLNKESKPNVLLVIWEQTEPKKLGNYGATYMQTPTLDQLSKTGITFSRSFVQEATCAPSRDAFLSGLRPDSFEIYGLGTPLRKARPHILTMPQFFRNHGYETISIGKVFHHYKSHPDTLSWSKTPITVSGRWKGREYVTSQNIAKMQAYQKKLTNGSRFLRGKGPAWEEADVADTVYKDGKRVNRAISQLHRLKRAGKPFLLAVGLEGPHLPFVAPKKYWDMYPPPAVHLPKNYFSPKDTTKYSLTNFGELRGYSNIPGGHEPIPDSTATTLIRGYQAAISYDDAQTGRILDALQKLGLSKNTIVVFWSDHGGSLGHHRHWSKHTNYEIDTHVPLVVRVPWMQMTARRSSKGFVESVDVFPTLAELCGLEAPANLQGNSFVPLVANPDRPWKEAALSQYPRGGDIMGYSMRTDLFRYTEWVKRSTKQIEARELYDHHNDPGENVNVIGDTAKYGSTIDSLSILMHTRWKQSLTPGGFSSLMPDGNTKN